MPFIYKRSGYWNVTNEKREDVKSGVRVSCDYCVIATAKNIRVAWKSFTIKMRNTTIDD